MAGQFTAEPAGESRGKDQTGQVATDDIFSTVSKRALGGGGKLQDSPMVVESDNAVRRALNYRSGRLSAAERRFHGLGRHRFQAAR